MNNFIYATYCHLLAKHFYIKPVEISEKSNFKADLGFSSLDFIDMILVVETTFAIEFENRQLDNIQTVADLMQCLERHLSKTKLIDFVELGKK
jgi:acyl carrier protein